MVYPKADCCPFNSDEAKHASGYFSTSDNESEINMYDTGNDSSNPSQCEMMRRIQEIDFAIIDLNLFLDTHPNCTEALELFTKLTATSKSLKHDYQSKHGPLFAAKSSGKAPFEWVDKCTKWPWEM